MVARIAIEGLVYSIDKPYSYLVPASMQLSAGMRVSVPFGRGNQTREGMVLALEDDPSSDRQELKSITAVMDAEPVLDDRMLRLAAFVRERCFCTFYEAIRTILPAGLWLRQKQVFSLARLPEQWEQRTENAPLEHQIIVLLQQAGGALSEDALQRQTGAGAAATEAAVRLKDRGWLKADLLLDRKSGDKTEKIIQCEATAEQINAYCARRRKSAPVQAAALELLGTLGTVSYKELKYYTGASWPVIRALERQGFVSVLVQEVLRQSDIKPTEEDVRFELNEEQRSVFEGLSAQMSADKPGAALLYGVTGSGKTAIYVNLIRTCLAQGKSAMLLVPEIALTPQLMSLFAACFGSWIAVLHSALPVGERYDAYKRVCRGQARVVLGTRSAVFAPLVQPGLIILDEEQEHTYKSENTPRYHAREIALYRGGREGALVLLGSATPSVESMYLAQQGVYRLYALPHRFNGRQLPAAELVDMKQEMLQGNNSSLSRRLVSLIADRMKKKEKTILLLNRRGGNRLVICVECGFVPGCPRCSVHLTYHMANERLMCHYCGYSQPVTDRCPECGGPLKKVGIGTQQLEYDLQQALPEASILRMDADTITPTNSHEKVLRRFKTEPVDVLIGTQMVAKGLNFEDVTLVGVVDADMSLYVDHFRSSENTFSLITQVVGRSGRGKKSGIAVIQTLTPQNPVLQQAARQDYRSFYKAELPLRRLRGCPPCKDLIQIGFVGFPEAHVETCAARFAKAVWENIERSELRQTVFDLLGPAPCAVMKVNNRYRFRLTLCCKNNKPLRLMLSREMKAFASDRQNKDVSIYIDINGFD